MNIVRKTSEGLASDIGPLFNVNFENSKLDDFIKNSDDQKKRFLSAFKDLLTIFLKDLQNFDTENKTKILNFLNGNHLTFLQNLSKDSSFLDKTNSMIDEAISLVGLNSKDSTKESDKKSLINIELIKANIQSSLELAINSLFTSRTSSNEKIELTSEEESENIFHFKKDIIELIHRKPKTKGKSKEKKSKEEVISKNLMTISVGLYFNAKKGILKSRSILSQLLNLATISTSVSNSLFDERSKLKGKLSKFERKLKTLVGWIESSTMRENIILYFKNHHFIVYKAFSAIGNLLSSSFWKNIFNSLDYWSKTYVKRFMLEAMFPILHMPSILKKKIYNSTLDFLKKHERLQLYFSIVGLVVNGIFSLVSFMAKSVFNITKKLISLISNPLKSIVNFFIKLMFKPWGFALLGMIAGKMIFYIAEKLLNGGRSILIGNERQKTEDMTYLKKLGSEGIFASIQLELDFIDSILSAAHDFFDLFENRKNISESTFFKKLGYDKENKQYVLDKTEVEARAEEDKVYNFTFKALSFIDFWFIGNNGKPSRLFTVFDDFFKKISEAISMTLMNIKADELSGDTLKDKFMGNFNFVVQHSEYIVNNILEGIRNLLGVTAGNIAGKMGAKATGQLISKLPIPGYGKIAALLFGTLLPYMVGSSFGMGLVNIDEESKTLKSVNYLESIEKDYSSGSVFRPLTYIPKISSLPKFKKPEITNVVQSLNSALQTVSKNISTPTTSGSGFNSQFERIFYNSENSMDENDPGIIFGNFLKNFISDEKKLYFELIQKLSLARNSTSYKSKDILEAYIEWLKNTKLNKRIKNENGKIVSEGEIDPTWKKYETSIQEWNNSGLDFNLTLQDYYNKNLIASASNRLILLNGLVNGFMTSALGIQDVVDKFNNSKEIENKFDVKEVENYFTNYRGYVTYFENLLNKEKISVFTSMGITDFTNEFSRDVNEKLNNTLKNFKTNPKYSFVREILVQKLKSSFYNPFDKVSSLTNLNVFFENENNKQSIINIASELLKISDEQWMDFGREISLESPPLVSEMKKIGFPNVKSAFETIWTEVENKVSADWEEYQKNRDEFKGNDNDFEDFFRNMEIVNSIDNARIKAGQIQETDPSSNGDVFGGEKSPGNLGRTNYNSYANSIPIYLLNKDD